MRFSRKGWVLLTTVLFISLVFAFYFLVYVKGNEGKIIANKMRVLTQIKLNIDNLRKSEEKIAENQKNYIKSEIENITQNESHTLEQIQGKIDSLIKIYAGWSLAEPDSNGFFWKPDGATWVLDSLYIHKKDYSALFGNDLIERRDVFDFITITTLKDKNLRTLYSNFPLGNINFSNDTTTYSNFTSKNIFEIDFGYNQYLAFNTPIDNENVPVYLTGFVNKAQYNEEKREVSVFFITIAIILTVLIILGLPIIKLSIMSNTERLYRKDVLFAGVSLVIGPTILILFFLFFTTNILSDDKKEKDKLEELSGRLSKNFNTEIANAVEQLKFVKATLPPDLVNNDSLAKFPFFCELETAKFAHSFKNVRPNDTWNKKFRYFNSIFWTDSLGTIQIYLSSEKDPNQIISLNHRKYIMNIVNAQYLNYKRDSIAIESIRSVSDGNYEIGVGMVSGHKRFPVLATSFSLVSLIDPILEEGYGFCVFNSNGETLFHSENKRNLNENFLDETGGIYNTFLKSGVSHHTSVTYMGKDHSMYIKKLPEFDGYFLATFGEIAYSHSPNALALNMTIEMQMAYLALLSVCYLILYACAIKKSKLKQKIFIFNWLKPYSDISGTHKNLYVKLLLVNCVVLFYILLSWRIYYPFPDILIHSIISTGVSMIALHFWYLSKALPENEKMYTQFHRQGNSNIVLIIIGLFALVLLTGKVFLMIHSFSNFLILDVGIVGLTGYGIYRILNLNLVDNKQTDKGENKHHKAISFFKYFEGKNWLD